MEFYCLWEIQHLKEKRFFAFVHTLMAAEKRYHDASLNRLLLHLGCAFL